MKKTIIGLMGAMAFIMIVAWGTDTATLMWNAQTGQCNSAVDFDGDGFA
jgi:hypothetical protein